MKKIKMKKLLKETITWNNRKFGERLPTLADYKEAHGKKSVTEKTEYQESTPQVKKALKDIEKSIMDFQDAVTKFGQETHTLVIPNGKMSKDTYSVFNQAFKAMKKYYDVIQKEVRKLK